MPKVRMIFNSASTTHTNEADGVDKMDGVEAADRRKKSPGLWIRRCTNQSGCWSDLIIESNPIILNISRTNLTVLKLPLYLESHCKREAKRPYTCNKKLEYANTYLFRTTLLCSIAAACSCRNDEPALGALAEDDGLIILIKSQFLSLFGLLLSSSCLFLCLVRQCANGTVSTADSGNSDIIPISKTNVIIRIVHWVDLCPKFFLTHSMIIMH